MKKIPKTTFTELFGISPQVRVWDFLIGNHMFDFPLTKIAKQSRVSYNSIKVFFFKMVKEGFIIKTRKVGKSDYYKLNLKNPITKKMIQLDWALTKKALGEVKK